jgi:hypothetical protein
LISLKAKNGGVEEIVSEHSAVVIFELEAYPEPKILSASELKSLLKECTYRGLAKKLGCSLGFVFETAKVKKSN